MSAVKNGSNTPRELGQALPLGASHPDIHAARVFCSVKIVKRVRESHFFSPWLVKKPQGWLNFLCFRKFHISKFSKTIHHIWMVSISFIPATKMVSQTWTWWILWRNPGFKGKAVVETCTLAAWWLNHQQGTWWLKGLNYKKKNTIGRWPSTLGIYLSSIRVSIW